jgi:L-threonylcarbamoyladenylate synthase
MGADAARGSADTEIERAARLLDDGGMVAFPTETVYGLGAVATDESAVRRVFELKGRPPTNPLIVHVDGVEMARSVVSEWPDEADALARRFWAGPLTLVLPKGASIPDVVTGGGATVGVRCPDHPVALALIRAVGRPLVAPSANPSGSVSPTRSEHVRAAFPDLLVLEGGPCRAGIESTVVSLDPPVVLRPGVIGAEEIAEVIGRDVGAGGSAAPCSGPAPSPGLPPSHYAPGAEVRLCEHADVVREIADHPGAIVIAMTGFEPATIKMPAEAGAFAARLYDALREADRVAGDGGLILVVRPVVTGSAGERAIWEAVLDRLERASAPRQA